MVQGLRICLAMQETRVRFLVRELKIPRTSGQLSPCATTTETRVTWSLRAAPAEPVHLEPRQQEKPKHQDEGAAPAHRNWRTPRAAAKTQCSQE